MKIGTSHLTPMLAAMLAPLMAMAGCSGGEDRVATYPVRGRVVVAGEPAAGAFVAFHPVGDVGIEEGRPTALVGPDGSFSLTTFAQDDGAPAGEYAVSVEWRKVVVDGGEALPGPNVVPPQYARAETTPLKATVAQAENDLPEFRIDPRRPG